MAVAAGAPTVLKHPERVDLDNHRRAEGRFGMNPFYRSWAAVDLDRIRANVRAIAKHVAAAEIMAVVKADGYGHGGPEVARAAIQAGATRLAVALPEEGGALRSSGLVPPDVPILVLGAVSAMSAPMVVEHGLEQVISSRASADALAAEAQRAGVKVKVHLKVDTGMGRLGFRAGEEAVEAARYVATLGSLEMEGVMTHFAEAESEIGEFTEEQLRRFTWVLRRLEEEGLRPRLVHASNSAAAVRHPAAQFNCVRLGIMMYGLHPGRTTRKAAEVKPALSWKARIAHVKWVEPGTSIGYGRTYVARKREAIATVPVGYADGFRRGLSNRWEVLIDGERAAVVGNVCMDQFMAKLPDSLVQRRDGDLEGFFGEEVVILGEQGSDKIGADEMAQALGTINYEVVTGISWRVPRVYLDAGRAFRWRSAAMAVDQTGCESRGVCRG